MNRSIPACCRILSLAMGILAWGHGAVPRETGTPFLHDFSPREAGGSHPQNWAVTQDARGFIYAGNGFGVLEYDGVRWRIIETRNRSAVRALAWGSGQRLYVGGEEEIGYLTPGAPGAGYVSLTELAGGVPFGGIRNIHPLPQGIFFQARDRLLLYEGGKVANWTLPGGIWKSYAVKGRLYLQGMGGEVYQWAPEGLKVLPGMAALRTLRIAFMLPLEGEGLLLGTLDRGLYRYEGGRLKPSPTDVDDQLATAQVYSGIRLADGNLALSTVKGGAFILDPAGRLVLRLNRSSGMRDDAVYQCFQDAQSGLWMGLNNGLCRAEWPSPLTRFDDRTGLATFPWSLARNRGVLYAATGQGVSWLDTGGAAPVFRNVAGVKGQCLGLASAGNTLLAACTQVGVLEIQGAQARVVAKGIAFPACILESKVDPARFYVGGQEGVASIRRGPGNAWVEEGQVPGIRGEVFALMEAGPGTLWVSTRSHGLVRAVFPSGGGPPEVAHFGVDQGLPAETYIWAMAAPGKILAGTPLGVYSLDEARGRFLPDPAFRNLFPAGPRMVECLRAGTGGRIWMQTTDRSTKVREAGAAVPDGQGGYRFEAAPFQRFSGADLTDILPEPDGVVWLGGPDGLFRYDPTVQRQGREVLRTRIRHVQAPDGRDLLGPGPVPEGPPQLAFKDRSLRFVFALPSFDQETLNRYQVQLEGYEKQWSPWSSAAFKEYTNLPEGRYRFRVRGMDVSGRVSGEDSYEFRLQPPWYRSWWARALYFASAVLFLLEALRLRTRYLEKRNRDLSLRVTAATSELLVRNRIVVSQAAELRRVNDDLRNLNARLNTLNEQKNQLFGIASHDLRNPLNAIVLSSELLEEEESLEQARDTARKIRAEGLRMSDLLGRFLDIAAIESGTVKPEPESFPLAAVATHVAKRFEDQARKKGIDLVVEASSARDAFADLRFTKGILDNLLSNAIKFTYPSTRVTVRVEDVGEGLVVSVSDEGPGFTEEDRHRLFGRFVTLSARPTGGESSSGLGLSIVKHMADAMGAALEVQSRAGCGATFRLSLPRA